MVRWKMLPVEAETAAIGGEGTVQSPTVVTWKDGSPAWIRLVFAWG